MVVYPLPCYLTFEVTLYYGPRAGLENKLWFSINRPGGFLLPLGGPGCKSAGPCHLELACNRHEI